jgi:hypothetical protein
MNKQLIAALSAPMHRASPRGLSSTFGLSCGQLQYNLGSPQYYSGSRHKVTTMVNEAYGPILRCELKDETAYGPAFAHLAAMGTHLIFDLDLHGHSDFLDPSVVRKSRSSEYARLLSMKQACASLRQDYVYYGEDAMNITLTDENYIPASHVDPHSSSNSYTTGEVGNVDLCKANYYAIGQQGSDHLCLYDGRQAINPMLLLNKLGLPFQNTAANKDNVLIITVSAGDMRISCFSWETILRMYMPGYTEHTRISGIDAFLPRQSSPCMAELLCSTDESPLYHNIQMGKMNMMCDTKAGVLVRLTFSYIGLDKYATDWLRVVANGELIPATLTGRSVHFVCDHLTHIHASINGREYRGYVYPTARVGSAFFDPKPSFDATDNQKRFFSILSRVPKEMKELILFYNGIDFKPALGCDVIARPLLPDSFHGELYIPKPEYMTDGAIYVIITNHCTGMICPQDYCFHGVTYHCTDANTVLTTQIVSPCYIKAGNISGRLHYNANFGMGLKGYAYNVFSKHNVANVLPAISQAHAIPQFFDGCESEPNAEYFYDAIRLKLVAGNPLTDPKQQPFREGPSYGGVIKRQKIKPIWGASAEDFDAYRDKMQEDSILSIEPVEATLFFNANIDAAWNMD